MFPSKELPGIVNDGHSISVQSDNVEKTNEKQSSTINDSNEQCGTKLCIALILLIIAIAISIGLLSIFIPKPNNNNNSNINISTTQLVTMFLVLPITNNTIYALSMNNNTLTAGNYLNNAQRNILKACLQIRLNSRNESKLITDLSIDSARAQYSGINYNNQTKLRQRKKRTRLQRQILSQVDQIAVTLSIQCNYLISITVCQQFVESVLDNGESLSCNLVDELTIILNLLSSSTAVAMKAVDIGKTHDWRQIGELFLAFGLTSLVGLERQLRGKSAGLRTHSIVGTSSALILLVSKYGFSDVIYPGVIVLDPSRIAAQIISGISFLGAGLIITRQKAIRGLTTAASVWSAAAIGMAAGSGLWVLSLAVTGLHFVILLGFLPLEKRLPVFDRNSPFHLKPDDDGDNANENDNNDIHSV
ncbi:unnamed protein product [Adineta steineri]|uniref:MgtC/SapB/SrpB/YhiD N-terminal domain-containing protein n=1 Tax=Adineta steineri TaxID=433720 RepID=A0A815B7E3_9BILA|nr:unnamed protein product [Adineta steineri]CAF1265945.1 unnamed protein product [Adineta steineri]CAF1320754.1 unnamed protein product [Adineta steineri]